MNRDALISKLPAEKGEVKMISRHQDFDDIITEVLDAHDEFMPDYDRICMDFAGGDVPHKLYDFCKRNLRYAVETGDDQTTKSPTVLLKRGRCDCKGYAGFIAGVLDGLNRCGQGHYDWCYRFAEYDNDPDAPRHVFVVMRDQKRETWIDPVLSGYNKRDPEPIAWEDKTKPMLVRMSGLSQPSRTVPASLPAIRSRQIEPLSAYRIGTAPVQGYTAAQLGIPIAQAVFQHWPEYPGAIQELAVNPPFRFFVGNQQIPLPPAVTTGGTPVPMIPAGLRIVWDPSFMGLPIPVDMLNVQIVGPALQVYPTEIYSAGGTSATTNNLLWKTNRYLLFLFLGCLENLIASYSSWPWGDHFDDLAQQLNSNRTYGNWLVYPFNKKTFVGNLISQAAQVYTKVQSIVTPIEAGLANAVIPGSGAILNAAGNLETSAIAKLTGNAPPGSVSTTSLIQANPAGTTSPGGLSIPSLTEEALQFAQANPIPTIGILAAVGLLLYEMFND